MAVRPDLVLLVDHDRAVREAPRFSLRLEGFCVRIHCDGLGLLADPALATRYLFAHAIECLTRSQQHCRLLGRGSAVQRTALFLLHVAGRGPCLTVVELAMSRQDIADYLGMTIETVSRTLSQMERDGLIALRTIRRVELQDSKTLRALTD